MVLSMIKRSNGGEKGKGFNFRLADQGQSFLKGDI
jgi:hypothetical protein